MALNTMTKQQVLDTITHGADHTSNLSKSEVEKGVLFTRGEGHITSANSHGVLDNAEGFVPKNRAVGANIKTMQERVKTYEDMAGKMPQDREVQRMLEQAKREYERQAENIYRDAAKTIELHDKAIEHATRDLKDFTKEINDAVKVERSNLTALSKGQAVAGISGVAAGGETHILVDDAGKFLSHAAGTATPSGGQKLLTREQFLTQSVDRVAKNQLGALEMVNGQHADYIKDLQGAKADIMKEVEIIAKDTGVSHASHFSKAAAIGGAEAKNLEKVAEGGAKLGKLKLGFNGGTAMAVVGVGAMIDGAKRLMSGFKGGVNEKGEQTPPDSSQQVIGAVEAGAGALALHKLVTTGGLFSALSRA